MTPSLVEDVKNLLRSMVSTLFLEQSSREVLKPFLVQLDFASWFCGAKKTEKKRMITVIKGYKRPIKTG